MISFPRIYTEIVFLSVAICWTNFCHRIRRCWLHAYHHWRGHQLSACCICVFTASIRSGRILAKFFSSSNNKILIANQTSISWKIFCKLISSFNRKFIRNKLRVKVDLNNLRKRIQNSLLWNLKYPVKTLPKKSQKLSKKSRSRKWQTLIK